VPVGLPFAFAGRLSVTVVFSDGTEPVLVTVTSKPMLSPALTGPAGLLALLTLIVAPTTVTDSFASLQVPLTGSLSVSPG
jgi:hypothetical protein